jgi:hypothetical protein
MLHRKQLNEEHAKAWMRGEELDPAVRGDGANVAVVLTQGWCPQWVSMNVWLNFMEKRGRPKNLDITVYEFIYDRVPFFDEFRRFKESDLGNAEIPYLLYYREGKLLGTSNYVTSRDFVGRFERAAQS